MTEPFIDCHHHLWDMDLGHYAWLEEEDPEETAVVGDYSAIRRSYRIGDLLADFEGCDVVKSVHIQAEYGGPDQVWETEWLQSVADQHGYPHGIIAKCDMTAPTVRVDLERHGEHANMRGIRNFVQGDDLVTPEFLRGLRALRDLGYVYDLNSTWEGMDGARRAAEEVDDLQFILGHVGGFGQGGHPGPPLLEVLVGALHGHARVAQDELQVVHLLGCPTGPVHALPG